MDAALQPDGNISPGPVIVAFSAAVLNYGKRALALNNQAEGSGNTKMSKFATVVVLPKARVTGPVSLEKAIAKRRSIREYLRKPITLRDLSQVIWGAQGVTDSQSGRRAAPSGGALYPLELYVVVREGGVVSLPAGVYHYEPDKHAIELVRDGDRSIELQGAAKGQEQIGQAAMSIVITAVYERMTPKYGQRGIQYALQESGAVAENISLQATALGLGTVIMGSFDENRVGGVVGVGRDEKAICILPIGFRR